jgi:hypothetical protein
VADSGSILVLDQGRRLNFPFNALMSYHGPGSPGGVAHSFKVMERAFPLLDPDGPLERRALTIRTAFGGPGARDGFELVTRAVTDGRYLVDPALTRPARGPALEAFVFRLGYRGRTVNLQVRDGFVSDEFIGLVRTPRRSAVEQSRLDELKQQMADQLMATPADQVYDAELITG